MSRLYYFGGAEADSTAPAPMEQGDGHARIDTKRDAISDSELDSGWPTTRKFARSMHGPEAAFPRDAQYSAAFRRFESALGWLDRRSIGWWVALGVAGGVVVALLTLGMSS